MIIVISGKVTRVSRTTREETISPKSDPRLLKIIAWNTLLFDAGRCHSTMTGDVFRREIWRNKTLNVQCCLNTHCQLIKTLCIVASKVPNLWVFGVLPATLQVLKTSYWLSLLRFWVFNSFIPLVELSVPLWPTHQNIAWHVAMYTQQLLL